MTLRDDLHWLPIEQRVDFKGDVITYRCVDRNTSPGCSRQLSTIKAAVTSAWLLVVTSFCHEQIRRRRRLSIYGPVICNGFPTSIHNIELSLNCFRRELKTFYFRKAYLRD